MDCGSETAAILCCMLRQDKKEKNWPQTIRNIIAGFWCLNLSHNADGKKITCFKGPVDTSADKRNWAGYGEFITNFDWGYGHFIQCHKHNKLMKAFKGKQLTLTTMHPKPNCKSRFLSGGLILSLLLYHNFLIGGTRRRHFFESAYN